MANTTSPSTTGTLALSVVPKLATLFLIGDWLMSRGAPSPGKLGLVIGILALFDAITLTSLRKGSVAVEWTDIGAILSRLVSPMVLPLYATLGIGLVFLSGPEPSVFSAPSSINLANNRPQGANSLPPGSRVSTAGTPQAGARAGSNEAGGQSPSFKGPSGPRPFPGGGPNNRPTSNAANVAPDTRPTPTRPVPASRSSTDNVSAPPPTTAQPPIANPAPTSSSNTDTNTAK